MTQTWRRESIALFTLWALATLVVALVARLPQRPVRHAALPRARFVPPAAPRRRPPTPRRPVAPAVPSVEDPVDPTGEPTGSVDEPAVVSVDASPDVEMIQDFDGPEIMIHGYSGWTYRSYDHGNRYSRSWRFRRGRILRPAASQFFSSGAVPAGASGDPCAVFPGACVAAPTGGGVYDPPRPPAVAALTASQVNPAGLSREGDRWTLFNDLLTAEIDVASLCRVTTRRPGEALPFVASFAAPSASPCTVRETAPTRADGGGVAVELAWNDPAGSMRVVVALADGGAALEASVARTDRSGATWLSNLGPEALTWTVGGAAVTVAPGGVARVSEVARARSAAAAGPAA